MAIEAATFEAGGTKSLRTNGIKELQIDYNFVESRFLISGRRYWYRRKWDADRRIRRTIKCSSGSHLKIIAFELAGNVCRNLLAVFSGRGASEGGGSVR